MRILLTLITLVLTTSFSFAQTEKTLVKTFNLKGSTSVVINLDGNVEVQEWGESTMRIHTNIKLENTNVNMLKYLLTKGRYNLVLEMTEDGNVVVTSPGRDQAVIINKQGDVLSETITYTVFVPRDVEAVVTEEGVEVVGETGEK